MKYFLNYAYVFVSILFFKITKKSLKNSNNALINLYSIDSGTSLLFLNNILKIKIKNEKEILNTIYNKKNTLISNTELKENGYSRLHQGLNSNQVMELVKISENLKCHNQVEHVFFSEKNITTARYNYEPNELANQSFIQKLIMDEYLIKIAREYFNSEPIFDMPAMWWSTPYGNEPSSEAAQLYHYDLDRVKWLKIFFYLTDVNDLNGPHHYIEKTHKINSKPFELLSRGYQRIKDSEIKNYYTSDSFKVIKGKKGSAFAADTLCWHKGKNLIKGNRLVLELNYTTSMFGKNSNKLIISKSHQDFINFCRINKTYSKNILIE